MFAPMRIMYAITIMTSITSSLIAMVKMFAVSLAASGDERRRLANVLPFQIKPNRGLYCYVLFMIKAKSGRYTRHYI